MEIMGQTYVIIPTHSREIDEWVKFEINNISQCAFNKDSIFEG